jgi:transcriptional regulator GlxA family with amidase domain
VSAAAVALRSAFGEVWSITPFGHDTLSVTRSFAILIFPGFPMMAFSSVIEPLRAANKLSGEALYSWSIVGGERGVIRASSGIAVTPDYSAYNAPAADYIVVCSGGDADRLQAPQPLNWIRKNLRNGANIGSVADGAFYLGRAGLLDGFSCTLHWQSQPAFAEAFPDVKLERDIYVIDRTRFTSAGGIGAFDMMLDLIGRHHGEELCRGVAEWFVHDRIRASTDRERLQLRLRTGIRDDLVLGAVAQFEAGGESLEISKVAARLGVTIERLERAFRAEVGLLPGEYYKRMKLKRARDLLEHSAMSVREIGLASGYQSFSAFVRAFRTVYGKTPGQVRRVTGER